MTPEKDPLEEVLAEHLKPRESPEKRFNFKKALHDVAVVAHRCSQKRHPPYQKENVEDAEHQQRTICTYLSPVLVELFQKHRSEEKICPYQGDDKYYIPHSCFPLVTTQYLCMKKKEEL